MPGLFPSCEWDPASTGQYKMQHQIIRYIATCSSTHLTMYSNKEKFRLLPKALYSEAANTTVTVMQNISH